LEVDDTRRGIFIKMLDHLFKKLAPRFQILVVRTKDVSDFEVGELLMSVKDINQSIRVYVHCVAIALKMVRVGANTFKVQEHDGFKVTFSQDKI